MEATVTRTVTIVTVTIHGPTWSRTESDSADSVAAAQRRDSESDSYGVQRFRRRP